MKQNWLVHAQNAWRRFAPFHIPRDKLLKKMNFPSKCDDWFLHFFYLNHNKQLFSFRKKKHSIQRARDLIVRYQKTKFIVGEHLTAYLTPNKQNQNRIFENMGMEMKLLHCANLHKMILDNIRLSLTTRHTSKKTSSSNPLKES